MKWLFWSLVLFNVGLFLWATGHQSTLREVGRTPLPPINADKMRLLKAYRAAPGRPPSSVTPIPEPAATGPANAPPRRCFTVGPFSSNESAARAGRLLRELGHVASERKERERVIEGYRVVIGPLGSAQAVEEMQKRLADLGISGYYILRSGLKNTIALGFFAQLDNAEKYIGQLAAKGIQAGMKVHSREGDLLYWFDVDVRDGSEETAGELEQAGWGPTTVFVRKRPCQ